MFTSQMTPSGRLGAWRESRQVCNTAKDVVDSFCNITVESRYIDYYTPSEWPTSFEIVSDGLFCQSGITLVMAATLHNKRFINSKTVTLSVISNHITGNEGLVLIADGHCFNFLPGEIVSEDFALENGTVYDQFTIDVDTLT